MEFKQCSSEVKDSSEQSLTIQHWISTESRDRGGDVILADGVVVDGILVVLKAHGRDPNFGDTPIGRNLWIKPGVNKKGTKGLLAMTELYDDSGGVGRDLWKRITTGFFPYWSIGYSPIESYFRTEPDGEQTRIVSKAFLYEYSLVSCGMNQEAVTDISKSFPVLQFKVLPGPERKKLRTIHIDSDFITKVIRTTVENEIRRIRGKVS